MVNPEKGYRLHFNSLHHSELLPSFAQAHAGTPMGHSRWYPNDPDLLGRESLNVKGLDDLLAIMQTRDPQRLADSIVIFGSNKPIPWKEFFIRESRLEGMERFADLYNRIGKIKGGDLLPCAMLFESAETKTVGHFRDFFKGGKKKGRYRDVSLKGKGMHLDGANIDFELSLMYLKNAHVNETVPIQEGDLFLVTGMVQRGYAGPYNETISVFIDKKAAMRKVTREELTVKPPLPKPVEPKPLSYEDLGRLD